MEPLETDLKEQEPRNKPGRKPGGPKKPKPTPLATLRGQRHFFIKVHETGDRTEQGHVFVGVNGVGYWIKRGQTVSVPEAVVKNLETSVKTVYETRRDDTGKEYKVARDAMAYPFTVLGEDNGPRSAA